MAGTRTWFTDAIADADVASVRALYAAISVSTSGVREGLRAARRPFYDPEAPAPDALAVSRTADHVIGQTQANTATMGAIAGVAGWLTVPPEVAGWIVAQVRLGQRLCIVYGLDPQTDRGQAALTRALAAAFETDLPERGLVGMRASDLVDVLRPAPITAGRMGAKLARSVVRRSLRLAAGRLGRLLPVVSSGVSARENHREAAAMGARMKDVLSRLAASSTPGDGRIVEAVEVVSP